MTLIDRHVLSECLQMLGLALGAIVGLLFLQNIYDNLKDLVDMGASASDILRYYLVLIPSYLPTVLPLSFMISILFGLGQLHRNNEITAMRACGLSLWRITRSVWGVGLLLTFAMFFLNARLVPWSVEQSRQIWESYAFSKQLESRSADEVGVIRSLAYYNHTENRLWFLNRFSQYNYRAYGVTVSELDNRQREVGRIVANEGYYDEDGYWVLLDGREIAADPITGDIQRSRPFKREVFKELTEDPVLMKLRQKRPQDLSLYELRRVLDNMDPMRDPDRLAYLVRYYSMALNPFVCLLVVGLSVPFAVAGVRVNPMVGVSKAMCLFFVYYVVSSIASLLGRQGDISPFLAAALPLLLAGGLAFWLSKRARFA